MWRVSRGTAVPVRFSARTGAKAFVTIASVGDASDPSVLARALRLNSAPERWVWGKQTHGTNVRIVTGPEPSLFEDTDGFATSVVDLPLVIRVADCVPVFLACPRTGAVGVVHAGWRGVRARILTAAVTTMERSFRCRPPELSMAVGPHIRPCCFEVGDEVAAQFASAPGAVKKRKKAHVDLSRCLSLEARGLGVREENAEFASLCTKHDERFHSFRRDGTSQRMAAVVLSNRRP